MASGQPNTSTTVQALDNRRYLFRLQMLIIDGGLLVLRRYVDQKLSATTISLSVCLANEKSTIVRLRGNKKITREQYDLLFPLSGSVSTSDLDITLIVCLLRNLKYFGLNPKFNWNTLPAQGDTSIEAAIYNLKRYRNEMSHVSTGIQHSSFKTLWKEMKEILLRINSLSANPIADFKQTIKDFKSCPLDPETEKRVQYEIQKWRELEKAVDVDLSIVKADNKLMLKKVKEIKEYVTEVKEDVKEVKEDVTKVKEDKNEMKEDVKEVRVNVKAVKEDVKEIKEDVKEFKEKISKIEEGNKSKDNVNNVMTESQYQKRKQELKKKLINFYKDKRSTVPLSPLVEEVETSLAGFYVMPDMVFIKQRSLTSNQEERIRVRSLRDLLITGSGDQQKIYLLADVGFGKTSFSKYLAITWGQAFCPDNNRDCFKDEELKALANFEFLFLVLLRDSTAVCKIDEIIEQQIIKTLPPSDSKYPIQEVLRREKCLIILDGLDEWTHPDIDCPDQIEKIPHRYSRDNCVILTTTRPWKLGVSNLKTSDIKKKVELVKLSKDSTSQLEKNALRKMSGVNDDSELAEKVREFDKVIKDRGLEHMQTIPLLLMYIICLWCNKIPIGNSKVEIYINIIEFLLSRTVQKYPEVLKSSEHYHSDIPEYVKKHKNCPKFFSLLKALAELAYHTLFNEKRENTLVFDRAVAEKYLKADYMKLSLLSGILTGSTTTTLIERTSKASFAH